MKTIENTNHSSSDPNSEDMKNRFPNYQQLDITALDELPLKDVLALHPDVEIPDYVPESLVDKQKASKEGMDSQSSNPTIDDIKNRYPDHQQLDISNLEDRLSTDDLLALNPDVEIPDYVPSSLVSEQDPPGKGINPDFLKHIKEVEDRDKKFQALVAETQLTLDDIEPEKKRSYLESLDIAKTVGLLGAAAISLFQGYDQISEPIIEPSSIPESSISVKADHISAEQLNILDELDIMAVETDNGIELVPKPSSKHEGFVQLDMLEQELGVKLERVNKVASHGPADISSLEHPSESDEEKHPMEFIQEDLFDLVQPEQKPKKKQLNHSDEKGTA